MTEQRLSAQNPRELTADEIDFVAGGINNTTNAEAAADVLEGSVIPEVTEQGKNPPTFPFPVVPVPSREDVPPPKSPNK